MRVYKAGATGGDRVGSGSGYCVVMRGDGSGLEFVGGGRVKVKKTKTKTKTFDCSTHGFLRGPPP